MVFMDFKVTSQSAKNDVETSAHTHYTNCYIIEMKCLPRSTDQNILAHNSMHFNMSFMNN